MISRFMDGGLSILTRPMEFLDFYDHLIQDIVIREGRIIACESFPKIFGRWPYDHIVQRLPPPGLVKRAAAFCGIDLATVKQQLSSIPKEYWLQEVTAINEFWTEMVFCMDLDYSHVTAQEYQPALLLLHVPPNYHFRPSQC